jgi:nucleoside-diphosphate-sugar epimerase
MKRRVVVCGATGFIGRNVAESLALHPAFDVIGIHHARPPFSHPGIAWRQADLTQRTQAGQAIEGADIVIQAAAVTSGASDIVQRPYIHVADNAVMNSHLLRAAFEHKVGHFVFFSCSVMYASSERPQKEDDFADTGTIDPKYFGAACTKLYIERMCEFYARIGETRFTVVRHSNVYGAHDKFDPERSHVFGGTVHKALTSNDGRMVVWGDGRERRDLLYVSDLVDFVCRALARQTAPFGLYNVGSGEAVPVQSLVKEIVAASGKNLRIENDLRKPTIPISISLDCTRAHRELGWQPKMSLAEGIRQTLDWYRAAYGEAPRPKTLAR